MTQHPTETIPLLWDDLSAHAWNGFPDLTTRCAWLLPLLDTSVIPQGTTLVLNNYCIHPRTAPLVRHHEQGRAPGCVSNKRYSTAINFTYLPDVPDEKDQILMDIHPYDGQPEEEMKVEPENRNCRLNFSKAVTPLPAVIGSYSPMSYRNVRRTLPTGCDRNRDPSLLPRARLLSPEEVLRMKVVAGFLTQVIPKLERGTPGKGRKRPLEPSKDSRNRPTAQPEQTDQQGVDDSNSTEQKKPAWLVKCVIVPYKETWTMKGERVERW